MGNKGSGITRERLLEMAREVYDTTGSLSVGSWKASIKGYPNGSIIREFGSLRNLQQEVIPEFHLPNSETFELIVEPENSSSTLPKRISEDEMSDIISNWLKKKGLSFRREVRISRHSVDFLVRSKNKTVFIEVKSCLGRPSGCMGFINGLGEAIFDSNFCEEVWLVLPKEESDFLNSLSFPDKIKILFIDSFT